MQVAPAMTEDMQVEREAMLASLGVLHPHVSPAM